MSRIRGAPHHPQTQRKRYLVYLRSKTEEIICSTPRYAQTRSAPLAAPFPLQTHTLFHFPAL